MFFTVDAAGDAPMYEQIIRQVKLAVADGTLIGGQMVPSVRALANELAINPNTIARAYLELQNDRILEPVRGRGMVVRRDAVARCTKARNVFIGDALRRLIDDAYAGGMTQAEIREQFEAELSRRSESNGAAHE